MTALVVRASISVDPGLLWNYLSTASGLACWQADQVEGSLEDGAFSLRWPQLGARLDLTVTQWEKEARLLLRAGGTSLELLQGPQSVELRHGGLDDEDDLAGLESSWQAALALLEIAATRHPRKTRKVHWLFAPFSGSAELAHHYFTDPAGLAFWLGSTDGPLLGGQDFQLKADDQQLTGTTLYSGRDVALRLRELDDGSVILRTLPGPERCRIVAIGLSSFVGLPPADLIDLFQRGIRRLELLRPAAG